MYNLELISVVGILNTNNPWIGQPYYSQGNVKCRRRNCICHRIWVGPGALGHIAGRGNIAINTYPVPSCLLLTSAPPDMPPSFSPAASGVCLGQGHLSGSPPVTPLNTLHSASAPLLSPTWEIRRGPLSWTSPNPWVLRQGFLWWNRRTSSYQGPSVSDMGWPDLPISLAGGWPPAPCFLLLCPGRGTEWRSPRGPSQLVRRRPIYQGWPAAQIPTPVGVTYSVQRNMTAGS